MAGAPQTHYLNSDFDLSLRPRPRQLHQPKLVRQVGELSVQALLGADDGDSVLLRVELPDEFPEHLERCGLPVPRRLTHPGIDPATRLRPFGWSKEAMALNRRHDRPLAHPDLEVIQRVNSRSFTLELEAAIAGDTPRGSVVESVAQVASVLSRAPASSAWLIKAEHGHAGLANRRLKQPRLDKVGRRFVEERLREDDRLLLEPWLPREKDWCVVFDVPFDMQTLRVHETVCTADGALIGALFEPGGGGGSWFEELGGMAERVARRLDRENYFGPVCVDAFTWRDGARTRLRPLVDLNCRLSMSDAAYRLWQRTAPERSVFYRFFNRRKLDIPDDMSLALAALGQHRYDPTSQRGTLLGSPLRLGSGNESWRPGKLAVLFFAESVPRVFELERQFRERFEV